ncbi:dihydrodipicolinate synthase family protein [Alicyclobacillus suci]|uniref:dihydrodipicolinate synthase family protein n=1 Tax=Alicyclobacillus suci TaxID=2816080 RepID=UPI003F6A522F
MMSSIRLPRRNGSIQLYETTGTPLAIESCSPPVTRIAYAAAHVVARPLADVDPASTTVVDWETTLAFRRHLWSLGLFVAEAMDTAQRGMGLDWETTKELIRRSVADARACGGGIACGAGTDHLQITPGTTLTDVVRAYEEQCEFIESTGGRVIVMASRALAAIARTPDDYANVYDELLSGVSQPVILHWLGDMFDPALTGYWGHPDVSAAMDVCLDVIRRHARKVEGIKISLLDAELEVQMRSKLPVGVKMYTGDDFHYPDLILGRDQTYSHALLGIFDAIAPAAAKALQALDEGDTARFSAILAPTVPLSRHIFQAPTRFYKTGVVFLAYLNGHQNHFRMVGGLESMRSLVHLSELFILADQAGLIRDPEIAANRMRLVLALGGVE